MANATKSTRKPATSKATETEAPKFEVFTEVPKRAYTLNRPAAHQEFFEAVRSANEGLTGDKRVFLAFPQEAAKKGVAAAIKKGAYRAAPAGEFEARTRTVDGVFKVLVTIADKA